MSLVSHILEAAYCNGTHHKLAFHALEHLGSANAGKWKDLFLSEQAAYLRGSKAPDKEFKDFKNHVLHVKGNLWGGAPESAREWYQRTVTELKNQNWTDASYAAGVLSHYLTDPLMPFHTEQSEAESNIHRAFEWSVSKSYDSLKTHIDYAAKTLPVDVGDSNNWLEQMVIDAAYFSNRDYQFLIDEYDFKAGTNDPPKGLHQPSRIRLAICLGYAQKMLARALDRAIEEAGVEPPAVSLTAPTILAALEIPLIWVTRKMADAGERKLVKSMYREFVQSGVVDKTLTEDVRVIRDLVGQPENKKAKAKVEKPSKAKTSTKKSKSKTAAKAAPKETTIAKPQTDVKDAPESELKAVPQTEPKAVPTPAAKSVPKSFRRKNRVTPESGLASAPSIGKRTAEHFAKVGISTVEEFLEEDAADLAKAVAKNYITTEVVRDWQDQARLACDLPQLRGHDVQILVGGGIRSLFDLAEAEPESILAKVTPYLESDAGKKVVKPGDEPTIIEVEKWVNIAEEAVLAA